MTCTGALLKLPDFHLHVSVLDGNVSITVCVRKAHWPSAESHGGTSLT